MVKFLLQAPIMPLDTSVDTQAFLYFRDIHENPLPQSDKMFSSPHDERFFIKFQKYLKLYIDGAGTDEALSEAFNQLYNHACNPLSTRELFSLYPSLLTDLFAFYSNEKFAQWQPRVITALVALSQNKAGEIILTVSDQHIIDEYVDFCIAHFNEFNTLLYNIQVVSQHYSCIKEHIQAFFNQSNRYFSDFSAQTRNLPEMCDILVLIGQKSYDNFSIVTQQTILAETIILRQGISMANLAQLFKLFNFVISFDPRQISYFFELIQPAIMLLYAFDSELQVQTMEFIGKAVQLKPDCVNQCLRHMIDTKFDQLRNNEQIKLVLTIENGQTALQLLLKQLLFLSSSGYENVRNAIIKCITFLIDGPLRKDRAIFSEIVSKCQENGVEYEQYEVCEKLMQGCQKAIIQEEIE